MSVSRSSVGMQNGGLGHRTALYRGKRIPIGVVQSIPRETGSARPLGGNQEPYLSVVWLQQNVHHFRVSRRRTQMQGTLGVMEAECVASAQDALHASQLSDCGRVVPRNGIEQPEEGSIGALFVVIRPICFLTFIVTVAGYAARTAAVQLCGTLFRASFLQMERRFSSLPSFPPGD
jgi:hypothetical protein